jgi:hypothetical protein
MSKKVEKKPLPKETTTSVPIKKPLSKLFDDSD